MASMQKKIEAFAKKNETKKMNEDWEFTPANVSAYLEGDEGSENGCLDKYLSEIPDFLSEQGMSDDELMPMDMLDDNLSGKDPWEILRMGFNGYDYNPYHDNNRAAFNPNKDYYFINGYGNLVSVDEGDVDAYYKRILNLDEFAEYLIDNGLIEESDYLEWLQDSGKIDADEYDRRISGGDEE